MDGKVGKWAEEVDRFIEEWKNTHCLFTASMKDLPVRRLDKQLEERARQRSG